MFSINYWYLANFRHGIIEKYMKSFHIATTESQYSQFMISVSKSMSLSQSNTVITALFQFAC